MWWMLAGVALQAVQGIQAAKDAKVVTKAKNKQIEAYNKTVGAQTAKSFNEIALQKTYLADQTALAIDATQRQGAQLKSARGLQAAGTDTMGASVDQSLLDVDQKVSQAQSVLTYNEAVSDASLNAQAQNVADSGSFSQRPEQALSNSWAPALGNAMASLGMSLFENKAKTGSFSGATKTSRQQGID
jgi:hypothetical protein